MRKSFQAIAAMALAATKLSESSKDMNDAGKKFSDQQKQIHFYSSGPIFFPSKTMKINRKRMLKRMK